ncbi:TPA: dTDP-glucose 4,6-dehydratase [Vibrio parahaemolyticus]|uniref:dTDP-glucose 4,6-dehydratase n=1 Tax=Vibrio parahaemolyticus TaxID=670 RepID=UPI00081313A4|nr:dTDP-glucose 4,6-dehydratase [Vibrio parahaemolyticus]MBE5121389.1 dTDP-glucose 4,6-dehydratase [Vibrio parahaemolyticus]MBE5176606.1 dTDP-glucose 4,6-dehydratase [Vibrio parahaemolyticus]MDF4847943.1 dTDP-glucose 4,6-dehydratase [Vibrio parahaemolyticus]OCP55794.1 spore coat protein [Vibrio parahaemolyticus]HAS6502878.1 dTDP-glucose 4,6-dehydratase [Vibrio parahaemolyticus]
MKQRNILVTGGAGFIGANYVHYWLEQYPQDKVVVLDALTYAGNRDNLTPVDGHDNFAFVQGDICNTELVESLLKEHQLNTIVHFAAESHVDRSITGPDAFIETNILGTYSLLKAAKKVWLDTPKAEGKEPLEHRFHHVSTDEVYGTLEPNDPAFTENTPYAPNSPYSASKAASDHLVRAYHHTYGLEVTTSNCSNNYGPYHFPEKLIPLIITNILHDRELPIYGDGQQIRDWLYVTDHARGIDLVLNKGRIGENYNIGGHNEWANIDIVKVVCKLMNQAFAEDPTLASRFSQAKAVLAGEAESLITYVADRAGHDRRYAIDATKTNNELGYKPAESFETGIAKTVDWYLENEDWWGKLLQQY